MNIANYLTAVSEAGESGRYPLSTQALAFVQDQIKLLQGLANLGGQSYIISEPTASRDGLIVLSGEIMPLSNHPLKRSSHRYICVRSTSEDIHIEGDTYHGARTYRVAYYSDTAIGAECYAAESVVKMSSLHQLSELTRLQGASIREVSRELEDLRAAQSAYTTEADNPDALILRSTNYLRTNPVTGQASPNMRVAGILETWSFEDSTLPNAPTMGLSNIYEYYAVMQEFRSTSGAISYRMGLVHGPSSRPTWMQWITAIEPPKSPILGTLVHMGNRNGAETAKTGIFAGAGVSGSRGTTSISFVVNNVPSDKLSQAVFVLTPVSLGNQTCSCHVRPEPDYRRVTVVFNGVDGSTFEPSYHLVAIDPSV